MTPKPDSKTESEPFELELGERKLVLGNGRKEIEGFRDVLKQSKKAGGKRLTALLDAVYEAGRSAGAREVFQMLDRGRQELGYSQDASNGDRKKKKGKKKKK